MATLNNSKTIGAGPYFPITLTENSQGKIGWAILDGSQDLIKQNITSIMNYHLGEMIFEDYFGNPIDDLLEEPNTEDVDFLVKKYLVSAVESWEPRIIINQCILTREDSKLHIGITYQVLNTQSVGEIDFTYNPKNDTLTQN